MIQKNKKINNVKIKPFFKFFVLSQKSRKIKFFNFFFKLIKLCFSLHILINIFKNQLKKYLSYYSLLKLKNIQNYLILFYLFRSILLKKKIKNLTIKFFKLKLKFQLLINLKFKKFQNRFFFKFKPINKISIFSEKKNLLYNCFIKISKNNIRIHIQYYLISKLYLIISSGKYRIPGVNKIKKTMCETMGKLCAAIFKKHKLIFFIKNFYFFGPKHLIKTFLQNFNNEISINRFLNYKILINNPYNGCRLKKQRRL
jgi:hypothetical protein